MALLAPCTPECIPPCGPGWASFSQDTAMKRYIIPIHNHPPHTSTLAALIIMSHILLALINCCVHGHNVETSMFLLLYNSNAKITIVPVTSISLNSLELQQNPGQA